MGIWADHLHPKVWLEWEVLGWIIGTVFAIGGIVLVFDQYLIANVCFGIVTVLICVKVCQIAILSKTEKLASRALFVLFICSLTIFALTETVGGVNRYKSRKKLEVTRPVSEPVTEKSKSLPTPNNPQPSTAETAKGTYPNPKQRRSRSSPPAVAVPAPAPDVTLKFVYRESPALVIVNSSDVVARDMKWMVVLWNKDHPDDANPLQIPATAFDWLKPHTMSAPNGFLSLPAVVPKIKPGDHLIGSAAVD